MDTKRKSRSGRNLTDAERAAKGYGRITLRISQAALDRLGELADAAGVTRAEYVEDLLLPERRPTRRG